MFLKRIHGGRRTDAPQNRSTASGEWTPRSGNRQRRQLRTWAVLQRATGRSALLSARSIPCTAWVFARVSAFDPAPPQVGCVSPPSAKPRRTRHRHLGVAFLGASTSGCNVERLEEEPCPVPSISTRIGMSGCDSSNPADRLGGVVSDQSTVTGLTVLPLDLRGFAAHGCQVRKTCRPAYFRIA